MPDRNAILNLGHFVPASELQPSAGDLIEIDRTLYAHWALYLGNGSVVHVVGPNEEDIPTDWALVQKSSLEQVAGCSRVRVNNKSVRAKERGMKPLDTEDVLQRALAQVSERVEFNALTRNAEFYATQWKYGHGWSDQAAIALSVMKSLGTDLKLGHNTFLTGLEAVFGRTLISCKPSKEGSERHEPVPAT